MSAHIDLDTLASVTYPEANVVLPPATVAALVRAARALEEIAQHPVISESGSDDCDWHCTAEIVALAKDALAPFAPETGEGVMP